MKSVLTFNKDQLATFDRLSRTSGFCAKGAVTTAAVLEAASQYVAETGKPYFTTREIANHLEVKEYMVRSAMGWLRHFKLVEPIPELRSRRITKTTRKGPYWAMVYQIKEKSEDPDFKTLHTVFCCGR